MSFTNQNIASMTGQMKRAAGALLAPQTVDLYQGATVEIKLHVGQRRAGSSEVTAGSIAENQYATIDADDWDAKAGRAPQKGDTVHWAGRRFAVEDCQTIAPAGVTSFYKARLRG